MQLKAPQFLAPRAPTKAAGLDRRAWWACWSLTIGNLAFAAFGYPSLSDLLPALRIFPAWIAAAFLLSFAGVVFSLICQREPKPIKALLRSTQSNWRANLSSLAIVALAGLNLIGFMWIKPLLNQMVPFWADPLLANIDYLLFFGSDPWTLLTWANFALAGVVYHPIWFLSILIALLVTSFAPNSQQKSAIIVSYFVLWSLVAPGVHSLLPAAGPIFYEALGYGPRFAGMQHSPETAAVAAYLWNFFESGSYGAGNGISAMPSMHVATSTWVVIATAAFKRRWLPVALLVWLSIVVLSIALGWHYALDGMAGTLVAFISYRLSFCAFRS